jgi:hypothetical protein
MIPYLTCPTAREMLDAFVDLELPMDEQVAVEAHLRWCATCAARVADMRLIGAGLRVGAALPAVTFAEERALSTMQSEVFARVAAEREQSWPVRSREWFADMRYMWPAIGATAALVACMVVAMKINNFIRTELPDSIADQISVLANPGSDRNPLRLDSFMLAPRTLDGGPVLDGIPEEEAVFALATVVTREGRIANYELLQPTHSGARRYGASADPKTVLAVLDAVKDSRFAPAQTSDGAVAVNMVWLLARTTVKASAERFIDPPRPAAPHPARS